MSVTSAARLRQLALDEAAAYYDPTKDGFNLSKDPRCLWGWGPPTCNHRFGHACFRALGHPGKCYDHPEDDCKRQRPKDWDDKGRAEANA